MITDHIADMLTRLRNASLVGHERLSMPSSKMKVAIARILQEEGFIRGYKVREDDPAKPVLQLELRYGPNGEPVILGLKRISKPGLRVYVKAKEIPRVVNGLGIAILSTPQGVMVDRACRRANVGGELLCYVW